MPWISPVHFGLVFELDPVSQAVRPSPVWAGDWVEDFTIQHPGTAPVFAVQSGDVGPTDVVLFRAVTFTITYAIAESVPASIAARHPRRDLIGPERVRRTIAALKNLRARRALVASVTRHCFYSPCVIVSVEERYPVGTLDASVAVTFQTVNLSALRLVAPVADEEVAALAQEIVFGVLP